MEGVTFNNLEQVTMYAPRHTSIVRQLLANVPVRVVAALHHTSVVMIEKNYSRFIADHADEPARETRPQRPKSCRSTIGERARTDRSNPVTVYTLFTSPPENPSD
jgi:hypothetical protein